VLASLVKALGPVEAPLEDGEAILIHDMF